MSDVLRLTALLLVVVDPVSVAVASVEVARARAARERIVLLVAGGLVAAAVLSAVALAAERALDALDLSVPSAQLGAGLVLLVPAFARLTHRPGGLVRPAPAVPSWRLGVYPFGVPLLVGPWTIVAVLAYAGAEGPGPAAGAAALAVAASVLLAAAFGGSTDRRALRVLGTLVGVATALVAADLLHDGIFFV